MDYPCRLREPILSMEFRGMSGAMPGRGTDRVLHRHPHGNGTPLATGHGDQRCGAVGPYLLEAGISSSYHIAKFFGLMDGVRSTANAHHGVSLRLFGSNTRERTAHRSAAEAEGTGKRAAAVDIGAVIAKALTAAGLMKPQ